MWGYVREVAPDWAWLKTHDGQELKDFLPRAVYKKATDWVLEDSYSTKVAVTSESFGFAQSVSKLLKTVGMKPFDAEPDDNGFEKPGACDPGDRRGVLAHADLRTTSSAGTGQLSRRRNFDTAWPGTGRYRLA